VAGELLDRGWSVIGVARRRPPRDHARYRHISADLGDVAGSLAAVVSDAAAALQSRSWARAALVNNAAMGGLLGPVENVAAAEFEQMLAVNVVAPVRLMGAFVEHTPIDAALRIVNVSSGAAVRPFPGLAAYAACKAALRMAAMVLCAELDSPERPRPAAPDRAIVSYEPGAVDTDMQTKARALTAEQFPWVRVFREFEARGVLVPPERPAREIVSLLEGGPLRGFTERRLGAS
jgi:NAD(P)-dependent dehydrogenase (short-subunit alcohol dehydrogenase family)